MPVFRYAMKRTFTSLWTYVIFLIFLIIPIAVLSFMKMNWETTSEVWNVLYNTIMIFFIGFFISSLITKNISEEIGDGSLLLIISKPLSRLRILTEKILVIFIVMIISYLIIIFLPMLTFFITREGNQTKFFVDFWQNFWKFFSVNLLIQLFILALFTIFALFFSPKSLATVISLFLVFFVILNNFLVFMTSTSLYEWMLEIYVYVPIIITTIILLPTNLFIFLKRNFA